MMTPGVDYDFVTPIKTKLPHYKGHSLFIPVELCNLIIRDKFFSPFQLYIYLKVFCSGNCKLNQNDFGNIANALGFKSKKTVVYNLKILLTKNWVGYDTKTNCYYIRSFERVKAIENLFASRTGGEFDFRNIKTLKEFAIACVIGSLINNQKRRAWLIGSIKGEPHPVNHKLQFFPVSNLALSKILNISISSAFRYKCLARKSKYITIKKSVIETKYSYKMINYFRMQNSNYAKKAIIRNKKIVLQDSDKVNHCIRFKRRKKLETYIKDI